MRTKRTSDQEDPKQFGYQPNGTYAPAPAEIAKQCQRFRKRDSVNQLQKRAEWAYSDPLVLREVFVEP